MCVDTKGYSWERPATASDCGIMATHFPGIDFEGLLTAMSQDGAQPLTADLALVGAMMHTQPDDCGMRYVPFTGIETAGGNRVAKLPVMDQIVDWLENSALGTDMWENASDWCEQSVGARVHFAMNCGCGLVAVSAYDNGLWSAWKKRFNAARAHLFGRTSVIRRENDSIEGLDITAAHLMIWRRLRQCLEALPAAEVERPALAA
ncbi:MAG: hypothetical protein OXT65_01395 [Alphaproteobacteria bacterium]|nr:hypothetical protein [Alphaproteobacteria bacterium]